MSISPVVTVFYLLQLWSRVQIVLMFEHVSHFIIKSKSVEADRVAHVTKDSWIYVQVPAV